MDRVPVAIAGAGPVGLSLALGLARQGISSVLLEESAALSEHSKAPGILPRTLEIFHAWDALDPVLAEGTALMRVDLWQAGQREPAATIDLSALREFTAAPGVVILPQNRTEAILHDVLARTNLCDIRFGNRVTGFTQAADGVKVQVTPSQGNPYELSASFLVGCDGAHSAVRRALGWHLEGKTYPTRVVLADVRLPDARNDLPWPRFAVPPKGEKTLRLAIRMQPSLWRMIVTLDPAQTDESALAPDAIETAVERLFGAGPFEQVWASVFRIHCRTSPRFHDGRVFLAGDAAHINSPAGGQGMNSGIQDAHNLTWKLARIMSGAPLEPLASSYEAERRPVILTNVDWYTDLLTRTVMTPPPGIRSILLRVAAVGVRQRLVMRRVVRRVGMLDTVYSASPILSGDGGGLGARLHDASVRRVDGRELRLLDLTAREAALLLFDDGAMPRWDVATVSRLVADVPDLRVWRLVRHEGDAEGEADLVDVTGGAWTSYGAASGLAVLVRPDGHVGWMGTRPTSSALASGVRLALGALRA